MSHQNALPEPAALINDLLSMARAAGADAADALFVEGASLSLAQRLGKPERLERSESRDLGLRVLVGHRQAIVSSTDWRPQTLRTLVDRAVSMARNVPEDPFCGLADPDLVLGVTAPSLDLDDPDEPTPDRLIQGAKAAEEAALAVAGITNSEGAEAGWSRTRVHLGATNGFSGRYGITRHSLSVSVIAGSGTAMEADYDYSSTVFGADQDDPVTIGRRAGERAVRALNPRKVATQTGPVIYDPRVSGSLVGHLAGALNGASIARGVSFLKDKMGEPVFAAGISIIDDPFLPRGLRSRPFDSEGLVPLKRHITDDGRLTSWFLDLRSGRQLGLASTGHASRGTGGPPAPSPSNLYLAAGERSAEAVIAGVKSGLYVTRLMGHGANAVTGDYSRGAAGFWIEDGAIAYPVSELTIAGNLKEMFRTLEPANDLRFRYGMDAPTILVPSMTVAGV